MLCLIGQALIRNRFEDTKHLLRLLSGDSISVVVGPEKRVFSVSKKLLCDSSAVFKRALGGSFLEAVENKYDLPDVDVLTFGYYLQFSHTGAIGHPPDFDGRPGISLYLKQMLAVYYFADYGAMCLLQDLVMDSIRSALGQCRRRLGGHLISQILQNVPEYCGLWRFCAAEVAQELMTCRDEDAQRRGNYEVMLGSSGSEFTSLVFKYLRHSMDSTTPDWRRNHFDMGLNDDDGKDWHDSDRNQDQARQARGSGVWTRSLYKGSSEVVPGRRIPGF